jgi:hypothetical protein
MFPYCSRLLKRVFEQIPPTNSTPPTMRPTFKGWGWRCAVRPLLLPKPKACRWNSAHVYTLFGVAALDYEAVAGV